MAKVTYIERQKQALNWKRAFFSGVFGSALLMGIVDIFNMLRVTAFSYERYIGSLFLGTPYGTHVWTLGLIISWIIGGLYGLAYGYAFEFIFERSNPRLGAFMGIGHLLFAAFIVFPFFNMLHQQAGTYGYWHFGFLGAGIDAAAPILLLFTHILFGATMGLFYGPVRWGRARARVYEPGESGLAAELESRRGKDDLISGEEDARDRAYT